MEIKIEKSLLKVVTVGVAIVVVGIVWAKRSSAPSSRAVTPASVVAPQSPAPASASAASTSSGLTKENNEGEVTVSVTPAQFSNGELAFDIAINTHTVEMSTFDPQQQIVLKNADGKETLPSKIAQEGSGHHQTLKITFPKVEQPWKLLVREVGGIPAREFSW